VSRGRTSDKPTRPTENSALRVLVVSLAIGCLFIPLYAAQADGARQVISITGVALLVALAALLAGALLGFLFAIPRTVVGGEKDDTSQATTRYQANTNLEQISDWLTKILVGVGLTQISAVAPALSKYADYVGAGLGGYAGSEPFSIGLLVFFAIEGFLISFIWTRIYFAGELRRADELNELEERVNSLDTDGKAWNLVKRHLNPSPGSALPSQEETNAVVAQASDDMKAQIFWEAHRVRNENWRDENDKEEMERTIPVFAALIASDSRGEDHSYRGQLGYALKDQREPEWRLAEAELTKAIRIRGDWRSSGWAPMYEFNRAVCRIELDEAYRRGEPSSEATRKAILSDLEVANADTGVQEIVDANLQIQEWKELNGIEGT